MKRCPHCRAEDHDEAIICKQCHRYFNEPAAAAPILRTKKGKTPGQVARPARHRARPVLGAIRLLVLLAAVVYFVGIETIDRTLRMIFDAPRSPGELEAPDESAQPVRVGGDVTPPRKILDVSPQYPPDAQASGVEGTVVLEATINADGHVQEARVLRSIPMLDQAALDAVTQWRFEPTLVNGVATPVVMTVTVRFSLR